jgi:5-formyltetrahydrofolate cyclo-ligase
MTKEEIRILYKKNRRSLTAAEKNKLEDLMLIQFQRLPIKLGFSIMTYAPIDVQKEYDPYLVEEYCIFRNENTALSYPIVNSQTETMQAFIVDDDTFFEKNMYGVDEPVGGIKILPADIGVMFVPLLAFDEKGNRVGYGKGYYDKFIKLCNPSMIKIGFSFFEPVVIDDVNAMDEKLDFCITPERIYEF